MTNTIGGFYKIKDEGLLREVAEINSSGSKCKSYEQFMSIVFGSKRGISNNSRYLVCIMPCEYSHDLENENGSASPADAAEATIDNIVNDAGLSIYVWDKKTELCHFMEANEYVYQSISCKTRKAPTRVQPK